MRLALTAAFIVTATVTASQPAGMLGTFIPRPIGNEATFSPYEIGMSGECLPLTMGCSETSLPSSRLRREEQIFCAPPSTDSIHDPVGRDAKFSSPFCTRQRASVVSNQAVVTCVVSLLRPGGPSDIARFVVAVDVDSVQGVQLAGAFADVRQERHEICAPFFAHAYTPAAIGRIPNVVGVVAPTAHLHPRPMLWGFSCPVNKASRVGSETVALPASARYREALHNSVGTQRPLCAASADAIEVMAFAVGELAQYGPSPELSPDHNPNCTPGYVVARGVLNGADHEIESGFANIGDNFGLSMRPASPFYQRVLELRNKPVEVVLRPVPELTLEKLR